MPKVSYTTAKGLYQQSGEGVFLAAGAGNIRRQVITLSDAGAATTIRKALTQAESGALLTVPVLTVGNQTISLPAPSTSMLGVYYDFVCIADLSTYTFMVDTDASATKIFTAEPDGDGTVTVNDAADSFGFAAAADQGAAFRITCISATAATAWHVSNLVSGLAAGTGEHVAA